jgi:D-psicose/D-tagatose/L-ribulose 3-epimerase
MNLSVSNIAWPAAMDEPALTLLGYGGISAIEVAPTRLWPDWVGASAGRATEVARDLARRGFRVSSLQAILFSKPECRLFGSDDDRKLLFYHLAFCADLACGLGAKYIVFGAPKNRELSGVSEADAFQIACEFFGVVGSHFRQRGVCLCLEPNPPEYGCQFIVDSSQAARLVRAVNSEGFRLHLDTGCMHLAGEDPGEAIRQHADILRHFHVSEPFLGSFEEPVIDHRPVVEALEEAGYANWITLEMRAATRPLAGLASGLCTLVENYMKVKVI